jgi:thiol-disulfide isomerase/thioredoxin
MATSMLTIGSPLPAFEKLAEVSGQKVSSAQLADAKALVVVFSCNHCPYVQAYEDRMNAVQKVYADRGVRLVAVNSNDASQYPEDGFEEMVRRAHEKSFAFLYARDHDQSVARLFGATHTPEFFLFAPEPGESLPRLRYHGRMDDNHREPGAVTRRYLVEALEAVLAGTPVPQEETHSIGCTIKWKQ